MLPNISLNSPLNSQDANKQISMLRSQMASLKEALEDELQSISYDQLDAALRKKIDNLSEAIVANTDLTNIVAQTIKAEMLEVTGDITTINGNIQSINGSISTINGNISTMSGNISTNSGNISTLSGTVSGLRGEFDTLKTKAITTDNLSAQEINADKITTGTLSVARLSGSVITTSNASTKFKTMTVQMNILDAAAIMLGGATLGLSEVTISGTKYKFVSWSGGVT